MRHRQPGCEDLSRLLIRTEEQLLSRTDCTARVRSPLKWTGGKAKQARLIIEHLQQAPHAHYVEVFGGGASVLMRKTPSSMETLNDADGDLVNFWMQARDNAEALQARIDSLPYSRALYESWRAFPPCPDPVERAARFFYVTRSAFSGALWRSGGLNGWSFAVSESCTVTGAFRNATGLLSTIQERLRLVQIDCRDWRRVLRAYDRSDVLFYLDPPYIVEGADCYRNGGGWTREEHAALAEALRGLAGRFALSYYPHPWIDEWYGWCRRITYQHRQSGANSRKAHCSLATELLLLNYAEHGQRL